MFNSIELQNTFDELNTTLKSLSLTLDQISEDINKFEDYLKSLHLLEDVRMIVDRGYTYGKRIKEDPLSADGPAARYIFPCKYIYDELYWDSADKRLNYLKYEVQCKLSKFALEEPTIDDGLYGSESSVNTIICKPLIECKFDVRKFVHPYLSTFLKHIAAQAQKT
jgi:hypothetical protein